ncbi:hypothetical protein FB107DRAFT_280425 [Schizophyllum commune]
MFSPSRSTRQRIQDIIHNRFYDTVDRQPLFVGPIRTTSSRHRMSPYLLALQNRREPSTAARRKPPALQSGQDLTIEDMPASPNSRADSTEFDVSSSDDGAYSEDDVPAGFRQGSPLRAASSLASSSDGWVEDLDDRGDCMDDHDTDTDDHEDYKDDHVDYTDDEETAPVCDEMVPMRRTRSPSPDDSDCEEFLAQPVRAPSPNNSIAPENTASSSRNHRTAVADSPLAFPGHLGTHVETVRPGTTAVVEADSSRPVVPEQDPSAPPSKEPSVGKGRIPKPPGECGKPGKGGYSLKDTLGWPLDKYNKVRKAMNAVVDKHLDPKKSLTRQRPARMSNFEKEALSLFPEMDTEYEDCWPVRAFASNRLHYLQNNAQRRKQKEALAKVQQEESAASGSTAA